MMRGPDPGDSKSISELFIILGSIEKEESRRFTGPGPMEVVFRRRSLRDPVRVLTGRLKMILSTSSPFRSSVWKSTVSNLFFLLSFSYFIYLWL